MYKKIVTQTDMNLVTLAEAKAQCRLTTSFTMDDDYLESLIAVCSELAQNYVKRLLTTGTVIASLEKYQEKTFLYGGDITAIDSITATSPAGEEGDIIAFASVNPVSQYLTISPLYASYTDFEITYQCGYETVPTKVKQGILMMIASMYNNREDGLINQSYEKLPFTSITLLDSVRQF